MAENSISTQTDSCSRVDVDRLKAELEGLNGELVGHKRDGHLRAHLGRSFGRPEGEIQEDIDEVTQQLTQCNNQYH